MCPGPATAVQTPMTEPAFPLFRNDVEAVFLTRPNRFLVIAQAGNRELPCHCPNSGRMGEILLPGRPVILEARRNPRAGEKTGDGEAEIDAPVVAVETPGGAVKTPPGRKTSHTLVGARYRGGVVPLHAGRSAAAAGALVLPRLFPGAREIRAEYPLGGSRFDFFVEDADGERHLLEVKSCTLVEHGAAMFPDAPSLRALRHLEELAALSREGWRAHILFLVSHGDPEAVIPNLHTHPALAAALSRHRDRVACHGALTRTDGSGLCRFLRDIPVDLSHGELAAADSGSYLILLELTRREKVPVGALGEMDFPPGWYVYAGSASRGLAARTARHLRRTRKTPHWHLDHLRDRAASAAAFPIASYRNLECRLAAALGDIGGRPTPRFGSSDCGCLSHLYHFSGPPREDPRFIDLLCRFRHREALLRNDSGGAPV